MQVTETLSEGLKREFQVVYPAKDIEERLTGQLTEMKDRVRINGFRPGKVPLAHLRRLYGRQVMADVLQDLVNEANRKLVEENSLKLAQEPQVIFPEDRGEVEAVLQARGDLAYRVALEVLPKVELADISTLAFTREVAEVSGADLDAALQRMAEQNRPYAAKAEGETAANGDRVRIDFKGTIDGETFEGGEGTDIEVVIGSGSFIPGFEEGLVGAGVGETRTIASTFPENYTAAHLAGKAAMFDVVVKAVEAPGELRIDDELAKGFGLDSLERMRDTLREAMERDYAGASRMRLKRRLLDALDERHRFDLPQGLVDQEFETIWRGVETEMKERGVTFADEGTNEEEARAEYRHIAERRVRLGLVLAEIGERADIKVTDDEVTKALVERSRQFPGQERQVWDFYRENPAALAEIRAPIFEDKVVDHIVENATVTNQTVSREELFAADEGVGGGSKAEAPEG